MSENQCSTEMVPSKHLTGQELLPWVWVRASLGSYKGSTFTTAFFTRAEMGRMTVSALIWEFCGCRASVFQCPLKSS